MTKEEFKEIQKDWGLTNKEMGKLLFKAESTIEFWRSGKYPIDPNAVYKIRKIIEESH